MKSEFDLVHAGVEEIRQAKREIKEIETILRGGSLGGDTSQVFARTDKISGKEEIVKQLAEKKKFISQFAPKPFRSVHEKNKVYEVYKKIERMLQDNMPRSADYYQGYPKEVTSDGRPMSPDHNIKRKFDNAVDHQVWFQTHPKIQKAIQRYKHYGRRLDPDNPEMTNIERLRK